MTITLRSDILSRLHSYACHEVTRSHAAALAEISSKKSIKSQWETIFTAHLCKVMSDVAQSWESELTAAVPGLRLSMATVFTHQTPLVEWVVGATRKRCELADLLVVVIDRTSSVGKGTATLIQAKLSTTGSVSLSTPSEKKQFDLLSTRPKFDVISASAPTQIDLGHLSPDSALMYGLTSPDSAVLPSSHSGLHHWLTTDDLRRTRGSYKVTSKDCFAYMLTGMLSGNFGWEFDLPTVGYDWKEIAKEVPRDDWSTLINYLLEETFSKLLLGARSTSIGRPNRGQEDAFYFTGSSSQDQPMTFHGYETDNLMTLQHFIRKTSTETGNFQPGSLNDEAVEFVEGGGASNQGETSLTEDLPEGGPISVILFEIGMQG